MKTPVIGQREDGTGKNSPQFSAMLPAVLIQCMPCREPDIIDLCRIQETAPGSEAQVFL